MYRILFLHNLDNSKSNEGFICTLCAVFPRNTKLGNCLCLISFIESNEKFIYNSTLKVSTKYMLTAKYPHIIQPF